jgi:micrococcal nuclease
MENRRTTTWFAVALAIVGCFHAVAFAKAPQSFTGTVVKVSDGDTYIVKRSDGSEVKVRLHYADCPEVGHRKGEVDQPGGKEAVKFAEKNLLGKPVIVIKRGESYGRIVADMKLDTPELTEPFDVATMIVMSGHAQLDKRYKPTATLLDWEKNSKERKRGLWSADGTPIAPWEWRKLTRDKQVEARK